MRVSSPAPGLLVTSHVRLVAPLSRGAMGEIWTADHLTLSTQVAVKLIAEELVDVELARERFEREARLAAQLDTPHVVRHFDHGITEDGTRYIVMELLRGEALDERAARRPLDVGDTLQVLEEIGCALECAASCDIVHRDVKPENIFLCATPTGFFCKLLDFGVATEPRVAHPGIRTLPGTLIGTPGYMSPETVLGTRGPHHQDDLWALAVVAYEHLLGRQPFQGATIGALCTALANREYSPPSTLDPELGPRLDGFFERAFAKRPEDRFESVSEMLTTLHHALAGNGTDDAARASTAPPFVDRDVLLELPPPASMRNTDTVRPVTSLELPGVVPTSDPRWGAAVATLVTAGLLALPLMVDSDAPRAAATGWGAAVSSAAVVATRSMSDTRAHDFPSEPVDETAEDLETPDRDASDDHAIDRDEVDDADAPKAPRSEPEPRGVRRHVQRRRPEPERDHGAPARPPPSDDDRSEGIAPEMDHPFNLVPRRDLGF